MFKFFIFWEKCYTFEKSTTNLTLSIVFLPRPLVFLSSHMGFPAQGCGSTDRYQHKAVSLWSFQRPVNDKSEIST